MTGPLAGRRVIEIAGIGPGPYAAMMLADMGAEVIRVDRVDGQRSNPLSPELDVLARNRKSIAVDLKRPDGVEVVLRLVENADAILEGFRPGVMDRLGVGADACQRRNPKIVVGRVTGWGQTGPYADRAGHDINYIALAGVLAHIGRGKGPPPPPLSLIGDFGGGGMLLAFGIVCGILEAHYSGQGQVVDAAMLDGAASLMSVFWGLRHTSIIDESQPGTSMPDGGSHFYDTYECSDGKYISVGAIEPHFYREFVRLIGLEGIDLATQMDSELWPSLKRQIRDQFLSRSRDEWCETFEGADACVAPVLTMSEAAIHPHNVARNTFVEVDGLVQPAPAPRFSRTNPDAPTKPITPGEHTDEILLQLEYTESEILRLKTLDAVS